MALETNNRLHVSGTVKFLVCGSIGNRLTSALSFRNPNMIWGPGDAVTQKAAQALGRELRDDFRATSGFEGPRVFVNYARGDETLEQIYSKQNLPRLSNLKKQWDPKNAFSFNNAIPSRYVPKH